MSSIPLLPRTRELTALKPYTAQTTDLAPELGRAFRTALAGMSPGADLRLHRASTSFVRRLRQEGVSPERVVVAIKDAIVNYGGLHQPPALTDEATDDTSVRRVHAYERVFAWYLEAYFGDSSLN